MQFPRSHQAASRDADALSPPLHSRRLHAAALLVAVAALAASVGLDLADDPRPLDVRLSTALHRAAAALQRWQDPLSRGLQVSLRAVADGREAAAAASAPGVTPRQLQPTP